MKYLKEYLNESKSITADELKELALEKADKGESDGRIYFKKHIKFNNGTCIVVAISDDGETIFINHDAYKDPNFPIILLADDVIVKLYNELKKL